MKPILINTDMVRAILEGRKTVTRRVVKPQPPAGVTRLEHGAAPGRWRSPGKDVWVEIRAPYQPGDILWVRETWAHPSRTEIDAGTDPEFYLYKADRLHAAAWDKWHPSIHMPREAARIFLRVTGVRVERLREMASDDVFMEGVFPTSSAENIWDRWRFVWDRTIRPKDRATYGWDANPWVWVIEFERIRKP